MKITVSRKLPGRIGKACVIVAVHDAPLSGTASEFDAISKGALMRAIERGDVAEHIGSCCVLHEVSGIGASHVMLVRCGDTRVISPHDYLKLCRRIGQQLSGTPVSEAIVCLADDVETTERTSAWRCDQLALAIADAHYRFTLHKGKVTATGPRSSASSTKPVGKALERLRFIVASDELKPLRKAMARSMAAIHGKRLTRDLGNTAPNVCTPAYLADQARELATNHANLKVKILDEARMKRLGMGAFLSVSRGSRQPAFLICMEYTGAASSEAPIVLVGKGITFDTGGISIKPSASLDEMKFDMCGAATVFGVMRAVAELQPRRNIIGVVAAAENMPDGDASRPGDVVTTMAGITVEILNTDAEGRMVLCDTLTYVKRYKPKVVIDMATLTGAAVIALGNVASALFSNDDDLGRALQGAADHTGDLAWQLPLYPQYHAQLESPFADLANIGGRAAGSITAACFLSRFTEDYAWAHLDIAGTASGSGKDKGATGRPVPLLMEYLFPDPARTP